MNTTHVPPGFRFHPTDEELVDYYLRKKVNSTRIDLDVIKDVDLYKIEPWDLQELCRVGTEEQNEWYFFSHKDKKYPTGTRTNRATAAGFWKATGRDKAIYSKHDLIGMRKTLVFYKGRAPNGQKSDWIMHEYRLETDENGTPQEEGWVVCRVFKKRATATATAMNMRSKLSEHDSPLSCSWYDDQQVSYMQQDHYFDSSSKQQISHYPPPNHSHNNDDDNNLVLYQQQHLPFPNCSNKLDQPTADHLPLNIIHLPREHFLHPLPLLDNPKLLQSANSTNNPIMAPSMIIQQEQVVHHQEAVFGNNNSTSDEQSSVVAADWRVLDKFVSSPTQMMMQPTENNNDASTSNSSCPMDLVWK